MKIQCPCGAKYAIDITPEMAQRPVQFICQNCGQDSSPIVNEMIRRELGNATPAPTGILVSAATSTPTATVAPAPASNAVSTLQVARPRIHVAEPVTAPAEIPTAQPCRRHPGQLTGHECIVCKKPMCPKCMELFGFVCSPFCKNKAEAQGLNVPTYAGQRSAVEAQLWRKVGAVTAAIVTVLVLLIGVWTWYAWFASRPKPVFAISYDRVASGKAVLCGKDQILVLHGDTLSRYDINTRKEIWAQHLVDMALIDKSVAAYIKSAEAMVARANLEAWEDTPKVPSPDRLKQEMIEGAAAALEFYVQGSNVWVVEQTNLVRHDWDTGKALQEIPMASGFARFTRHGDELVMRDENDFGQLVVTHIDLATAQTRTEQIGQPIETTVVAGKLSRPVPFRGAGGVTLANNATAGLPIKPGADVGKPMDPAKVAAEAQGLSYPGKLALPAVIANTYSQERTLNELNADSKKPRPGAGNNSLERSTFAFVQSPDGYVQFAVDLLQENMVARKAMKDPPKKSALDGEVNASQSMEVANEILNEMQRMRGGDTVMVDESRYRATIRSPDGKVPDWSGEVVGRPSLYPLKTINVIAAGTTLIVLDKSNKKLWQATLTHEVKGFGGFDEDDAPYGLGPCVERGDRLYVFDEAVLTAFDRATGSVHWRLPSVGVAGIFFDDKGMLYINTTTARPESLKYSRQIDITQQAGDAILKVNPLTGKIIWNVHPGGFISYVSGKFIYIWSANDADDEVENPMKLGLDTPSYVKIKRLDPGNGKIMWEHYQKRAPLDVKFDRNTIQIVFKKETQVLKYFSF